MAKEGYDAMYVQMSEQEEQKALSCDSDNTTNAVEPVNNNRYRAVKV